MSDDPAAGIIRTAMDKYARIETDRLNERITDLREQLAVSEACNTSLRGRVAEFEAHKKLDDIIATGKVVVSSGPAWAKRERERCAKVCDDLADEARDTYHNPEDEATYRDAAAAIRKGTSDG